MEEAGYARGSQDRTEQAYLSDAVNSLTFWPESWCRSFKRRRMPVPPFNLMLPPRIPRGAKIVVFHGRPNPDQAAAGFASNWRKRTRPAAWIDRYWV